MSDFKISDYTKTKVGKSKVITTGVSITLEQKTFLEENAINLSALVRDLLDQVMAATPKKKK